MTTETDARPFQLQALQRPLSTGAPSFPQRSKNVDVNRNRDVANANASAKLFMERQHLKTERFEYDRNGNQPGLILIFNQENFLDKEQDPRKGSRRDVNEIIVSFQRQGFNVDINNILTDGTSSEIREKLKEVAALDFTDYNCLIVFFLTHGEEFNMLHTKDGIIQAEEIWSEFRNCVSLRSKPKLFIFQACKGAGISIAGPGKSPPWMEPSSFQKFTEARELTPSRTFSTNVLYSDLLIVYSTTEGKYSYRNSLTGSWFIQELCKNVSSHGKRDDVVSIIIRTTKCVAGNYYHNIQNDICLKQMPVFISTLSKKFFLNRNKDRDLIIRIADTNEEILKTLKIIQKRLDKISSKDEDKNK